MNKTIKIYQFKKDIKRYVNKGVFKPIIPDINPILIKPKNDLNDPKINELNHFIEFQRLKEIKRCNNE